MEQKSDLRVTKTRRLIKATFLELVQAKPVQKITVTELAKRAEISKGTFISTTWTFTTSTIRW